MTLWESSRNQPLETGITTNFLGAKPDNNNAASVLDAFRADLPKISQKMADSLNPNPVISWFWSVYAYTLGSYASAKVGRYISMLEVAGEPALGGRQQFAGEHTSSDFLGYMNGGVQSGNRASAALIKSWHFTGELTWHCTHELSSVLSVLSRCEMSAFPVALGTLLD